MQPSDGKLHNIEQLLAETRIGGQNEEAGLTASEQMQPPAGRSGPANYEKSWDSEEEEGAEGTGL